MFCNGEDSAFCSGLLAPLLPGLSAQLLIGLAPVELSVAQLLVERVPARLFPVPALLLALNVRALAAVALRVPCARAPVVLTHTDGPLLRLELSLASSAPEPQPAVLRPVAGLVVLAGLAGLYSRLVAPAAPVVPAVALAGPRLLLALPFGAWPGLQLELAPGLAGLPSLPDLFHLARCTCGLDSAEVGCDSVDAEEVAAVAAVAVEMAVVAAADPK